MLIHSSGRSGDFVVKNGFGDFREERGDEVSVQEEEGDGCFGRVRGVSVKAVEFGRVLCVLDEES